MDTEAGHKAIAVMAGRVQPQDVLACITAYLDAKPLMAEFKDQQILYQTIVGMRARYARTGAHDITAEFDVALEEIRRLILERDEACGLADLAKKIHNAAGEYVVASFRDAETARQEAFDDVIAALGPFIKSGDLALRSCAMTVRGSIDALRHKT